MFFFFPFYMLLRCENFSWNFASAQFDFSGWIWPRLFWRRRFHSKPFKLIETFMRTRMNLSTVLGDWIRIDDLRVHFVNSFSYIPSPKVSRSWLMSCIMEVNNWGWSLEGCCLVVNVENQLKSQLVHQFHWFFPTSFSTDFNTSLLLLFLLLLLFYLVLPPPPPLQKRWVSAAPSPKVRNEMMHSSRWK